MRLKYLFSLLLLIFLIFFTKPSFAQEFRSDYKVEYFLDSQGPNLNTDVKFNVKITNLLSDVYVNKFSLIFPKNFTVANLKASDDHGSIAPQQTVDQDKTKIELEFSNPNVGKGTQNNFYVEFNQNNLFKLNGSIWEVILPTVEDRQNGDYQIIVHLPKDTQKKISIAKPKPDLIKDNNIYWNNPTSKTVYAIFGDKQYYEMQLTYNIQNPKIFRVYTDIALPPDTLHQKIFIESINPAPNQVFTDEDGNFLGRYLLNPGEKKNIVYKGLAEISASPRPEVQFYEKSQIDSQSKYLLTQAKYWEINSVAQFKDLKSPSDVYYYITKNFKYDYQRVNSNISRLGAENALKHPNLAVCTEFSDSFIAIAREKGVFAREIEGYGFSEDSQLRPLSLLKDILHSWPEYYNQQDNLWTAVDPTWENTSGIDYFSSFDLNHVAFAIHGKNSNYPLPAGMYKFEDTKDISIKVATQKPTEKKDLTLESFNYQPNILNNKTYNASITVKNSSNIFLYSIPINIDSKNLSTSVKIINIAAIAPLEKKIVSFSYSAINQSNSPGQISVSLMNESPIVQKITILPYYYVTALKVSFFLLAFVAIFFIGKYYVKRIKF